MPVYQFALAAGDVDSVCDEHAGYARSVCHRPECWVKHAAFLSSRSTIIDERGGDEGLPRRHFSPTKIRDSQSFNETDVIDSTTHTREPSHFQPPGLYVD